MNRNNWILLKKNDVELSNKYWIACVKDGVPFIIIIRQPRSRYYTLHWDCFSIHQTFEVDVDTAELEAFVDQVIVGFKDLELKSPSAELSPTTGISGTIKYLLFAEATTLANLCAQLLNDLARRMYY